MLHWNLLNRSFLAHAASAPGPAVSRWTKHHRVGIDIRDLEFRDVELLVDPCRLGGNIVPGLLLSLVLPGLFPTHLRPPENNNENKYHLNIILLTLNQM